MIYKKLLRNGAIVIAASLLTLTACKRDKTTTTTPALSSSDDKGGYASDQAKMERNSNDVVSIADAAVTTGTSNLRTTSSYPTVTRSTSGTDTIVTIDFGPTDHLCADLRNRKGEIIVTYSGRYKDSLSTHSITYNNYFVDDYQLTGSKTVENMGMNGSGQVWYTVTVNDSLILGTDSIVSWVGSRTRTWDAGYSTPDRSDDVYLIAGTTVLTRANGHVFTLTINPSDPLKIALSCRWIEAGTVTISSTTFTGGDRTLNYTYGTGGCDDEAQLTIGSYTYDITLL